MPEKEIWIPGNICNPILDIQKKSCTLPARLRFIIGCVRISDLRETMGEERGMFDFLKMNVVDYQ